MLPELHAVALQNVARLPREEQQRFELLCGDARKFVFPAEPVFLHLFDPFPAPVLADVLANLEQSLRTHARPVTIGYQNPVSEWVIESSPLFRKIAGTQQWALFESKR